jgi:hypothetical protein
VLWFYSRQEEALRVETRYDNNALEFVLVVHWPDGRQQEERFTNGSSFRERLVELETRLAAEQWVTGGPPVFFASGWPIKRLV